MRYLSICSGIEAASLGWDWLDWEAAGFAEIDAFASAVLEKRYPNIKNYGDFTKIDVGSLGKIDILVGGTPCQDFSRAGKRAGLKGKNGHLTFAYTELVDALEANNGLKYAVWENVDEVLSFGDNTFGRFIGRLLGADGAVTCPTRDGRWPRAGVAAGPRRSLVWRVLDAQHFLLPQRRARLFVVVGIGAPVERTARILLEPSRDHRDGRETRARRRTDPRRPERGVRRDVDGKGLALGRGAVRQEGQTGGSESREARDQEGAAGGEEGVYPVWAFNAKGYVTDIAPTVLASDGAKTDIGVIQDYVPRRFLSVERERLQGFPDGWTDIPYGEGRATHAQRTKAIGNAIPVPIMMFVSEGIWRAECLAGRSSDVPSAGTSDASCVPSGSSTRPIAVVPPGTAGIDAEALGGLDFLLPRRLQKVLYALLVKPGQEFTLAQLFAVAGEGRGATQEIVGRLTTAGLVVERRTASRRYLRSDPGHPLAGHLRSMLLEARCTDEDCFCMKAERTLFAEEVAEAA